MSEQPNGDRQTIGRIVIEFDNKGNSGHALEGNVPIGPAICKLETVKAGLVMQILQAEQMEIAKRQSRGIVLPNGPLPGV